MGWIRCVHCEKLQCDFMAQTSIWIEPVEYVLQQVSCSYRTIWNAPKYYEMDRNISFGSNGEDWVRLLRKIPTWRHGTNFCINCTSSPRFAPSSCSYETIPNAPKHYESHQNMSLGSNGVDQVRLLGKITTWLCGTNICISCTSSVCFALTFKHLRNDPNYPQILRNTPKH